MEEKYIRSYNILIKRSNKKKYTSTTILSNLLCGTLLGAGPVENKGLEPKGFGGWKSILGRSLCVHPVPVSSPRHWVLVTVGYWSGLIFSSFVHVQKPYKGHSKPAKQKKDTHSAFATSINFPLHDAKAVEGWKCLPGLGLKSHRYY